MTMKKQPWIDTRLNEEEMDFLRNACVSEQGSLNPQLAGNISKSEIIEDKDNWFYETVLKKHTEKIFFQDCTNYYEKYIEKETPSPKFEMNLLWVNYQKKHEFNPIHFHNGGKGYSFVIFVKIPTHWEEQHALPISVNSNTPSASDFVFVMGQEQGLEPIHITLTPEDEGRMLFFPSWLYHQVYPFYECEEERVTISGNIDLCKNIPHNYLPLKQEEMPVGEYELKTFCEQKEHTINMMEERVKLLKKELSGLKKAVKKQ